MKRAASTARFALSIRQKPLEMAAAGGRDAQHTAFGRLFQPAVRRAAFEKRRAERTAEMRPPLAPVDTRTREAPPTRPLRLQIDAELREFPRAFRRGFELRRAVWLAAV